MRRARTKGGREPTIALINIVFLMLVFFMVAGALAPPLDPALTLVKTADLDTVPPPDALVVHPDGRLAYRGEDVGSVAGWRRMRRRTARCGWCRTGICPPAAWWRLPATCAPPGPYVWSS